MIRLVAIAYLSPLIALSGALLRLLRGPGQWMHKLFALSLFGNVLFVLVLILGYLESRKSEEADVVEVGAAVAPECVERAQGPLYFCEAPPGSELARIIPNAIYVAFDGIVRARFEFVDAQMDHMTRATICARYGRPWIDANIDDRMLVYSRYSGASEMEAEVSLLDRDGDGIPDEMVNWRPQVKFKPMARVEWRPVNRAEKARSD